MGTVLEYGRMRYSFSNLVRRKRIDCLLAMRRVLWALDAFWLCLLHVAWIICLDFLKNAIPRQTATPCPSLLLVDQSLFQSL